MRYFKISLIFILASFASFSQSKTFEIFGTISGKYNSKMYLFFDGNYKQRDSIVSEIKDGKFYFKGSAPMPAQARLHMDQRSFIRDIYIDNSKTYVTCTTEMKINKSDLDTTNELTVIDVKGSAADKLKTDFEKWLENLKKSKASKEEQSDAYYQKLTAFIKEHPKSKVSPYLLGKASMLSYSQVKKLNGLIDNSLDNTFETKSVSTLLEQLDNSANLAIGLSFQDVVLKDSSDHDIDTRQFRGKYTLIVCWASWCKPCRSEHPELNNIYEKYKGKGLEMVGVSFDTDRDKWKTAVVKDKLNWRQAIDPKAFEGAMAKHYTIQAIPTNFLLDKDGKVIGEGLSTKEIEEMMGHLL
ncbi:TlpA disulfide reductase family protein [Pinibacter aurantiacus]|uniref:AhpC/TSA family protein n=1 Tax=Pinibacter aurantiacus TaxID=2851599 RepID=A0A9E2SC97_9BACT|nr:TlpA disulfide reductase family protein [Pinibacter aurantiacus]MBV4359936.1 AhpC/TSA family protein [Pinibacter aurantiacus]